MKLGIVCIVATMALPLAAPAQEKPLPTYRLSLRFEESGAEERAATRKYVLVLQSRSRGKINASRRLPFYTSAKGESRELHTVALGSIIECIAEDTDAGVRLNCDFESSYVAPDQPTKQPLPVGFPPVVNARQVSSTAVIAVGPEVLFAQLDDPSSNNRLAVFVSVERLSGPVGAAR